MWGDDDNADVKRKRGPPPIPAPKMALPGHAASYNPPEEYLPTEEEKQKWEEMEPQDRPAPANPRLQTLRAASARRDRRAH